MMGVESIEPKTPPFEIVNVPPVKSSTVIVLFLTLSANLFISCSTDENDNFCAFLSTGVISPFGPETAILISL